MKKYTLALFLCCLVVPIGHSSGQTVLSVHDAVDLAIERHPDMKVILSERDILDTERKLTLGLQDTELLYFREGISDNASFSEQRWTLSQSADNPVETIRRRQHLGARVTAEEVRLDRTRASVERRVKTAYTDVLFALEMLHLRERELQLNGALADAVTLREETGEASGLERMKANLQLAAARRSLAEAEQDVHAARYALFAAVGIDPDNQTYDIAFPDTLLFFDPALDQSTAMAFLQQSPAVQEAQAISKAARKEVIWARSMILPDLKVDYYPQDTGTGFDQQGFQVGLTIPLFSFTSHRRRVARARASANQADWRHERTVLEAKRSLETAWHGYDNTRRSLHEFTERVRSASQTLLEQTSKGYRLGELDLLTLLDTQRLVIDEEVQFYVTLRAYYHHLIQLEQFAGADLAFTQIP